MGGERKKKGSAGKCERREKKKVCGVCARVRAAALLPRLPLGSLKTATGSV